MTLHEAGFVKLVVLEEDGHEEYVGFEPGDVISASRSVL